MIDKTHIKDYSLIISILYHIMFPANVNWLVTSNYRQGSDHDSGLSFDLVHPHLRNNVYPFQHDISTTGIYHDLANDMINRLFELNFHADVYFNIEKDHLHVTIMPFDAEEKTESEYRVFVDGNLIRSEIGELYSTSQIALNVRESPVNEKFPLTRNLSSYDFDLLFSPPSDLVKIADIVSLNMYNYIGGNRLAWKSLIIAMAFFESDFDRHANRDEPSKPKGWFQFTRTAIMDYLERQNKSYIQGDVSSEAQFLTWFLKDKMRAIARVQHLKLNGGVYVDDSSLEDYVDSDFINALYKLNDNSNVYDPYSLALIGHRFGADSSYFGTVDFAVRDIISRGLVACILYERYQLNQGV